MRAAGIAALLTPLLTAAAAAQKHDEAHVAELQRALLPVHSVSAADRDYADLRAFAPALDGVRVLFIGEPSHGDGTAFQARGRMIEFLHRELGFNTLAFETGLFSIRRALEGATSRDAVRDAAFGSIFAIWSQSQQAAPALAYAASTFESAAPLRIVGMDAQLSGRDTLLLTRLDEYVARQVPDAGPAAHRAGALLHRLLRASVFEPVAADERQAFHAALDTLRTALDARGEDVAAAEWRLFIDNAEAFVASAWRRSMEPREAQMTRNLLHLLEQDPHARIIVWIASVYAVDRAALHERDGAPRYYGEHSAASRLRDAIGKDVVYSLLFTASGGTYGTWGWSEPVRTLEPPQPGSIEELFAATRLNYAILDLRGRARPLPEWLGGPLVARPLGYAPMRARWSAAADGFFLIREMSPSTRAVRD